MTSAPRRGSAAAAGARRRARELALAVLYRADLFDLPVADALASLPETLALAMEEWPNRDKESRALRHEAAEYAGRLVAGVLQGREPIDQAIEALSAEWPLERLGATDRAVLRLALWELGEEAAPPAALVNEAVELAREYGEADSPRFVNGILGAWLRQGTGTAGSDDG